MLAISSSLASSTAAFRSAPGGPAPSSQGTGSCSTPGAGGPGKALTPDQQKQVDSLKQRDAEVRQHEAAHLAAAGGFAKGGPVYNYQTGPDGRRYAVGGHVDVDTSAVAGDPKATLAKARQVQRAALAPTDPSGQDHAVAASAAAQAAKAQVEIAADRGTPSGRSESKSGRNTAGERSAAGGTAVAAYARSAGPSPAVGGGLNVLG